MIRRPLCVLALVALVSASGCGVLGIGKPTVIDLGALQKRYEDAARESDFAQLAQDARAGASQRDAPSVAVAYWQIAALSAWRGGSAGHAQLDAIVHAGVDACERLTPPDFAAPRDCLVIRMTPIYAAYDEARPKVEELETKTGGPGGTGRLSDADGQRVIALFNGLERDFGTASDLRERFASSSVAPEVLENVDASRRELYCLAQKDIAMITQAGNNRLDALTPYTPRLTVMERRLPAGNALVCA